MTFSKNQFTKAAAQIAAAYSYPDVQNVAALSQKVTKAFYYALRHLVEHTNSIHIYKTLPEISPIIKQLESLNCFFPENFYMKIEKKRPTERTFKRQLHQDIEDAEAFHREAIKPGVSKLSLFSLRESKPILQQLSNDSSEKDRPISTP